MKILQPEVFSCAEFFLWAFQMGELLDELESTVKFLFQSAEESGHGSNYYVDHGCFEDIDAAMAMHVMNEIPSGMKKSEEMHLKSTIYESTLSTAGAVPLPQWGRLRYENTAFLDTTPSPMGKAKRRRLRRPKRKPTPPRCARQPLPREGARVDTPSFLWKEVPRRGGGWVRKAVFPTDKAFPAWGRWRAERAG